MFVSVYCIHVVEKACPDLRNYKFIDKFTKCLMLPKDFNNIPVPKNVPQHKLFSTVLQECHEDFNNVLSIMIMSHDTATMSPATCFTAVFICPFPVSGADPGGPGPPLSESLGICRLL